MDCVKPILVGKVRHKQRLVPCGKCAQCKANLRAEWCGRLSVENFYSERSYFLTLTYDNEHLEVNGYGYPSVWKDHIQRFVKRLRKSISMRYFCTAEYGGKTLRPHYHMLLFTEGILDKDLFDLVEKQWFYGVVHFGLVEPASIAYCTKYCMKDSKHYALANKPFRLMSKVPPLGCQKQMTQEELGSFHFFGQKFKTSRLFRDKFYLGQSEDVVADYKKYVEETARARGEAHFLRWCRRHNRQPDFVARIDYNAQEVAKRERKQELVKKSIKQERL